MAEFARRMPHVCGSSGMLSVDAMHGRGHHGFMYSAFENMGSGTIMEPGPLHGDWVVQDMAVSTKRNSGSPVRAKLMQIIEEQPGSSIEELAQALGVSRGAVRHHVRLLMRSGHVRAYRQGNHRLHFLSTVSPMRRGAVFFLRIGSIRAFVRETIENTRVRVTDIANATQLSTRSVRRALKTLSSAGLVEAQKVKPGLYEIQYHRDLRIVWVLYSKDAGEAPEPLRNAPGWFIGIQLLFGRLSFDDWSS